MPIKPFMPSSLIENATSVHHGALNYQELESLKIDPKQVLDFSSNINPYGPPPGVREALSNIDISKYPDRDSTVLREALAELHGIDIDQVTVGNGSAELIWLIAFSFLEKGDKVGILGPTFGEYERCVHLMGGYVKWITSEVENHFISDVQHIHDVIKSFQPRYFFICNPNNPTGTVLDHEDIRELAYTYSNIGFIIDEAYLPFVPELTSSISLKLPNVLILRSMTKDFSLAGLRLGYVMGPKESVAKIAQVLPAWNVNSYAQAAGVASLAQKEFVAKSNAKLKEGKLSLVTALGERGFSIFPSKTPYFLMDVGDAASFRLQLLQEHCIQVRDCTSFGLPGMVRISTKQKQDNQKLLDALLEVKI